MTTGAGTDENIIAVFTTTDSREEADAIASALVGKRLAACVQISTIDSAYLWEGETRHDAELRLMIKTNSSRYEDVEATIRELHSYDLPAIYAVELDRIHAPYAEWVIDNSGARRD